MRLVVSLCGLEVALLAQSRVITVVHAHACNIADGVAGASGQTGGAAVVRAGGSGAHSPSGPEAADEILVPRYRPVVEGGGLILSG